MRDEMDDTEITSSEFRALALGGAPSQVGTSQPDWVSLVGFDPLSETKEQDAVLRDLTKLPMGMRSCTEAVLATSLGQEIDARRALSIGGVSKELRELMGVLRGWAEASDDAGDVVDELGAARAARREATAG